ncbi:MAG: hypothetical protein WC242_03835 [Candidatus Paceibacterota bacterium]|jgi:phosphatidylserine/phosphatidylglycerophosphate/cardiolipin synthase-like enzyme
MKKPQTFEEQRREGFLKAISKARSRSHVYIMDALLPSDVFSNEEIISAIKSALERGVEFHVLTGPRHDRINGFFLTELGDKIEIRMATPSHYSFIVANDEVVCDIYKPRVRFLEEGGLSAHHFISVFFKYLHQPE